MKLNKMFDPSTLARCESCEETFCEDSIERCPTCNTFVCPKCADVPFCKACRRSDPIELRIVADPGPRHLVDEYVIHRGARGSWCYWSEDGDDSDGVARASTKRADTFCELLRENDMLSVVLARTWDRWEEIVRDQYIPVLIDQAQRTEISSERISVIQRIAALRCDRYVASWEVNA